MGGQLAQCRSYRWVALEPNPISTIVWFGPPSVLNLFHCQHLKNRNFIYMYKQKPTFSAFPEKSESLVLSARSLCGHNGWLLSSCCLLQWLIRSPVHLTPRYGLTPTASPCGHSGLPTQTGPRGTHWTFSLIFCLWLCCLDGRKNTSFQNPLLDFWMAK